MKIITFNLSKTNRKYFSVKKIKEFLISKFSFSKKKENEMVLTLKYLFMEFVLIKKTGWNNTVTSNKENETDIYFEFDATRPCYYRKVISQILAALCLEFDFAIQLCAVKTKQSVINVINEVLSPFPKVLSEFLSDSKMDKLYRDIKFSGYIENTLAICSDLMIENLSPRYADRSPSQKMFDINANLEVLQSTISDRIQFSPVRIATMHGKPFTFSYVIWDIEKPILMPVDIDRIFLIKDKKQIGLISFLDFFNEYIMVVDEKVRNKYKFFVDGVQIKSDEKTNIFRVNNPWLILIDDHYAEHFYHNIDNFTIYSESYFTDATFNISHFIQGY